MITLPKEILKEIMRNRRHINAHKRGQARTCNLKGLSIILYLLLKLNDMRYLETSNQLV